MKKIIHILRTTVFGGVLFLVVPLIVLVIILGKALEIARGVMTPLAELLPFKSFIGLDTPWLMGVIFLVVVCFLAGLFAKTKTARKLLHLLETNLLSYIPGYSFIKNLGEEAAAGAPTENYQSILVRFDDAWQLGFLVERVEGGRAVVFIPDSPNPLAGGVFVMDMERITLLDEASTAAYKSLQKLGAGTGDLIKEELQTAAVDDKSEN
jgi:uncharacterized membrane protein